ncbi:odorant receptor 49b-like [Leptopilina heterotoma]|uniref:odorant receptor 49b-like n=1 Tax=Leptopilina heterotoma TaxID=63436 RepID=UPI001CA981F4|nr:odorant receptor 49b-like [Leptopilina heterotoma]
MQEKCDYIARRNTKYFFVISILTALAVTFGGLIKAQDNITLPYKASFPYDYNRKWPFYLTYIYQTLFVFMACLVTVGFETFFMTMIIQICSQLDIIFYRLQSLPLMFTANTKTVIFSRKEAKIIKKCVMQHNYVYRFCGKLNSIFGAVLGFQLFGSILNICTLIYSVSTKNVINDRTVIQSMALASVLFQLFLYCHFGHEVMVKSLKVADVMNMMDWTVLTKSTQQHLLLISIRASRPIIIMSGSIIPVTYDTFLSILKTSYTAYNLLKTINA